MKRQSRTGRNRRDEIIDKLLIANRGEIAIRIARSAALLGIATVAIHSVDDIGALHTRAADAAVALPGIGPAAYLDIDAVVAAALATSCDAVHPGYGFLSESAAFARACGDAGLIFVGPSPDCLALFGDKRAAKTAAVAADVPVLSDDSALPHDAAILVKAVAGGGGRGIRIVRDRALLADAIAQAGAEALAAFGSSDIIVERHVANARHIEVQLLGDATGAVVALGTRDCTLQRRHQKLIEIAPAPGLDPALHDRIVAAAIHLLDGKAYVGLATAEFLVDRDLAPEDPNAFAFIEVNPRLQVEHTVTEAVTGVDLVSTALRLAGGATLDDLGLLVPRPPRGTAIQLRINAETIGTDGTIRPATGTTATYEVPTGPGVRVDSAGHAGFAVNPRFDALLAKVVVHADDWPAALVRARAAANEFRIVGLATNLPILQAVLRDPAFVESAIDTGWFDRNANDLITASAPHDAVRADHNRVRAEPVEALPFAGEQPFEKLRANGSGEAILAPLSGVLIGYEIAPGDAVRAAQTVAIIEALKMQHLVVATRSGIVSTLAATIGNVVAEGAPVLFVDPGEDDDMALEHAVVPDPDFIRADLAEANARHALGLDANRLDSVARRRKTNQRTARENLDDLFDADSFIEYGALAVAAQRRRRSVDDLMRNTPHDGLVGGIGTVNAADHGEEAARCLGLAYDYTVLAGTQGHINHRKTDRLLGIAEDLKLPIVFYTEGGGGRPGDVDAVGVTGLDTPTFRSFAKLSGIAPRIGITSGYSFAGNAVLFGTCDITIATRDAHIGMGGPAMIEGGGLGVFGPKEIGPVSVQFANGVVDILADDEAHATALARTILGHFQGRLPSGDCADQRLLRHVVPENRLRVFDVRAAILGLVDTGSFVELRGGFAPGMITALARIDGRAVGLLANDCRHLSGAIDSDGADKAARFFQLCDAFGLPIVSLCDTPGFMVGPDAERTAPVRHGARMFVVGAALTVPIFTVVLRKGYGLGAQAMAGGSLHAGAFTVAWPTGEFGGMGLEGAVRLGYRKELEAIADLAERDARYRDLVQTMYDRGKAVSVAQFLEIDAVIDPADTRKWLMRGLASVPPRSPGHRRYIDTW